ncbi:MAG TPA: biopolymer transporter ExbD [Candidatus Latescibacteria bacterium]|mgnify:CR=1 FL=1|jgi:biopolymer transport protein ExbD|nr:biopolymer transporter ExbD [Gemmatimonadaceae bacterium]MDP7635510.1 biopolymer transporter ExbD [Candidatus Latescibacterota bacterium]HJP31113.1 biopolymer transporter ExbD [Candidatus Latescibacterota bacterium]|tara:strand:+ start:1472 stop:1885 length:414 start_codon:yes stop_codon:yes gene_type:complete
MRFARKSRVGATVPTASMADIAFLLLVFFMVSTVFVRYRGLPVELPDAEKIEKLEMRRHVTSVWVGANGAINIDDRIVGLDQVGSIIHAQLTANPRLIVSVKADGRAEFGVVSDVIQELRKVEALRVNFATDREKDS